MRVIKGIAWLVLIVMSANMVNVGLHSGMNHGVGLDTFLAGTQSPWQALINSDLVMGLLYTCAWIGYRERGGRLLDTIVWIWLVQWWGNVIIALYVLIAARQSEGDWPCFLMGRRAPGKTIGPGLLLPLPVRVVCLVGAVGTAVYLLQGLSKVGFAGIPAVGYFFGFVPIAMAFGLMAIEGGVLVAPARKEI